MKRVKKILIKGGKKEKKQSDLYSEEEDCDSIKNNKTNYNKEKKDFTKEKILFIKMEKNNKYYF